MRRCASLFLIALLLPVSAQAQMVVSSFGCRPTLPCDTSSVQFPTSKELVANASTCVSHYMSTAPGVSVFQEVAGLDSSGCLTTNPQAFPATGAGPTIPHCCVKKLQADICGLQCDVVTQ